MHRYLKILALAALAFITLIPGFNALVDPYGIWHDLRLTGFNALKPAQATHQRIAEMGAWARNPTPNLILGTSRADIGLDPGHPGFAGATFNFAISSQPTEEARRLLLWASDRTTLRQVVLATDFFTANVLLKPPPDFVESNFTDPGSWRLALSLDTLDASLKTVLGQSSHGMHERGDAWDAHGFRLWDEIQNHKEGGHRKRCVTSEKNYRETYLPSAAGRRYAFSGNGKSAERDYRELFARAHQRQIDLHVLISPSHARQWTVVDALGLWPVWEEWKRLLVRINAEEARRAGKPAFPLWDFSGYNSLTTEPVPPLGDSQTQMRWYWESSHYKKELGDLVLDRIFSHSEPGRSIPADFGVRLTPDSLEPHLAQIRADRQRWRAAFPEDVAEIEALMKGRP